MDYEVVIGLEVHAELATKSKIFCGCKNEFGGEPNTHCCPVCSGHPGVLPVLNRQAVEYAVKAGLALNCQIQRFSKFDRKNYFYPDLPKAYQISQFDLPFCKDGFLDVRAGEKTSRVRINRIHLEEDAGKLVHSEWGSGTLVDYNRCGVPLIEIVTEPDMRSPEEALAFLEQLKSILKYSGVSDCKMEQGSLRCDVNLSLRPFGQAEFGVRSEMKNVNSFSAAFRAMNYEIKRQAKLLDEGKPVEQETRRWDDQKGMSFVMRTKEDAHDYRYFPEPDLVPVVLEQDYIESLRASLPELPAARQARYLKEYGLSEYDAGQLVAEKEVSDFFDACAALCPDKKELCNWVLGEVLRKRKEAGEESPIPLRPEGLTALLALYREGRISQKTARDVFETMWTTGEDPAAIVEREGLAQNNDAGELGGLVRELVDQNPQAVKDFLGGNTKAMAFFVGQVMKATKGKANHKLVNELLQKELESRR